MVATLATISSGGSAGLLIPSTFFGAMIAAALAHAIGVDPASFVAPAITASLVSIVNVPLAAILLAVELFGTAYMVPALIALVAASIFSNRVSIYRTQREHFDRREILPGFSIRRVVVPDGWEGETLASLDVRKRFGLTVIGVIEHTEGGADRITSQMRLDPGPAVPLSCGDILVVMGRDELLDAFRSALSDESPASIRTGMSRR
jgi:CIC family chloride channel protein